MHFDYPHRRLNPLTNGYVLVSPHRAKRPWLGQVELPEPTHLPEYDASCSFCPGAYRTSGKQNPRYASTFTFENDFAAVVPALGISEPPVPPHPLMTLEPVHGACDVLIFHPRHDLAMARLDRNDIEKIIEEWIRIYLKRGSEPGIKYVHIFENKGAMMGCSNPHPHGQVWSVSAVPTIPEQELRLLKNYALTNFQPSTAPKGYGGRQCLLCEYIHLEMEDSKDDDGRVVITNNYWAALVPWWAMWPFEILVLPYCRHVESIDQLDPAEKAGLSDILSRITKRYDNLFRSSFPYTMGIHQRPVPAAFSVQNTVCDATQDENNYAHLHLHFEPPLLRSATVKKFPAGYDLMAEAQRDLTPEQAAARMRACSELHYSEMKT